MICKRCGNKMTIEDAYQLLSNPPKYRAICDKCSYCEYPTVEEVIKMRSEEKKDCHLRLSKCCGTCIHVNKPKQPEDHAAHYTVAKTQRWCYKNNIMTTRECICDDYEMIQSRGAISSAKRVFNFNDRAERIKKLAKFFEISGVGIIYKGSNHYKAENGWLYYGWTSKSSIYGDREYWSKYSSTESKFDRDEEFLYEEVRKQVNNK